MGGVTLVAQIKMIGSYTSANFSAKADSNGNVEIVDPTVPNGGSVAPGPMQAFPQHGIDLPDIAFSAQTTLAYAKHVAGAGGTLTVSDGRPHRGDRALRQLHRRKLRHCRRRPWRHACHASVAIRAAGAVRAPATPLIGARPSPSARTTGRSVRTGSQSLPALVASRHVGARNLLRCADTMTSMTGMRLQYVQS